MIECDCCHTVKEVSSIYGQDSDSFRIKMKERFGWIIIKEPQWTHKGYFWRDIYHTFCSNPSCQITAEMRMEMIKNKPAPNRNE